MRLYALVTSFSPLKVYIYRRGFARFTNSRYSSDTQDIYNGFVHLTNVAIQKTAENYDERTGKIKALTKSPKDRLPRLLQSLMIPFIHQYRREDGTAGAKVVFNVGTWR